MTGRSAGAAARARANPGRGESATTASMTAVGGRPSGHRPSGVAWVSTTLPAPSPSRMRMITVRGSGQVNSAVTGTPRPGATLNVTATRNRSSASATSTSPGADSTDSRLNEYGWNHEPCQGSSRLATTSVGSHTPVMVATESMLVAPGGRAGMTGWSRGSSPPTASSRTQASTPSSWTGSGLQPAPGPGPTRSPCQRHTSAPQSTAARARGAPRCGQAPGPTTSPVLAVPPGRQLDPGHGDPEGPVAAYLTAGGQHEPVAGGPGFGPLDRGLDQGRLCPRIGRLLTGPLVPGDGLQGPALGPAAGEAAGGSVHRLTS